MGGKLVVCCSLALAALALCHEQQKKFASAWAYDDRTSAYEHGDVATVLGIAGGALVATGVTLFVIGRGRAGSESEAEPALAVTTKGRGILLSGTF